MLWKAFAQLLPLLAAAQVHAIGGDNGEHYGRQVHRHHEARQGHGADHANDIPLMKRAKYVKTVTEMMYITVDQNGLPWGTNVETNTQEAPNQYLVATESTSTTTSSYQQPTTSTSTLVPPSSSLPAAQPSSKSPEPVAQYDSASGLTKKFKNGEIPCSSFPAAYGAVALDYLGNGGWSGIQFNGGNTDQCCEGALCSYACAPGQSKTQWPADQPASGESHGGLLCKNGFLTLTRPEAPYLCVEGKGSTTVNNKMSKPVAICRTDYPGTENMVIPTYVLSNSVQPLTVVNGNDYYIWQGGLTSAQYYVNKAGISPEEGCLWGTLSSLVGNFAPMVFGAGYSNGMNCISMLPNPEAKGAKLGYNVEIVGTGGTVLNKECSYRNGVFSGDASGCTVCFTEGTAQFVFTESY